MKNQIRDTRMETPSHGLALGLVTAVLTVGTLTATIHRYAASEQKRGIASAGHSRKAQASDREAQREKERILKMRDVNEALSDSFAERRDVETSYESNSSAGRPRNIKAETARVKVELGDELGGWSLRRNRDSSNVHLADDASEASSRELRRIEARLDRESREVRAEVRSDVRADVKNSIDSKSKKSNFRNDR